MRDPGDSSPDSCHCNTRVSGSREVYDVPRLSRHGKKDLPSRDPPDPLCPLLQEEIT